MSLASLHHQPHPEDRAALLKPQTEGKDETGFWTSPQNISEVDEIEGAPRNEISSPVIRPLPVPLSRPPSLGSIGSEPADDAKASAAAATSAPAAKLRVSVQYEEKSKVFAVPRAGLTFEALERALLDRFKALAGQEFSVQYKSDGVFALAVCVSA